MKKIFLSFLFLSVSIVRTFALINNSVEEGITYNIQVISTNISQTASEYLKNRCQNAISTSSSFFSIDENSRFTLVISLNEINNQQLSENLLLYYNLELNFRIIDRFEGRVFGSNSIELKGVGSTKEAAYTDAFKRINNSQKVFTNLFESANIKIKDYFNNYCSTLKSEVASLVNQKKYDEALFKLSGVPSISKQCFELALEKIGEIYNLKIENQCQEIIGFSKILANSNNFDQAQQLLLTIPSNSNCFSQSQQILNDIENKICSINLGKAIGFWGSRDLEQASYYLSLVPSNSKCAPQAISLANEMKSWAKEKYNKEINLILKKEASAVELEKLRIEAARAIGIAYGKSQPINVIKF